MNILTKIKQFFKNLFSTQKVESKPSQIVVEITEVEVKESLNINQVVEEEKVEPVVEQIELVEEIKEEIVLEKETKTKKSKPTKKTTKSEEQTESEVVKKSKPRKPKS